MAVVLPLLDFGDADLTGRFFFKDDGGVGTKSRSRCFFFRLTLSGVLGGGACLVGVVSMGGWCDDYFFLDLAFVADCENRKIWILIFS